MSNSDLKPENILLDYTGHIALCDFGLCKLNMGDDETTNTFCGTPEYLAPELLLGQGYTKAVDWWTLGVLLYEMLTGLPPFYSEDVNEMYRKILQDPLRFGDEVSRDARSILTLLLDRDPSKRLGTGSNGANDIKSHDFFAKHIDWSRLMAKKVQPPFKPAVVSRQEESAHCDAVFSQLRCSHRPLRLIPPTLTPSSPTSSQLIPSSTTATWCVANKAMKTIGMLTRISPYSQLSATVQEQFQGFSYNGNEGGMDAGSFRG